MPSWTLRQQRTRQMFEGEQQEHTAALRAERYVRRHGWQTPGLDRLAVPQPVTSPLLESRFAAWKNTLPVPLGYVDLVVSEAKALRPVPVGTTPSIPPCPGCGRRVGHEPGCGSGAGIRIAPAECWNCEHPHVEGVRCTVVNEFTASGVCGCSG